MLWESRAAVAVSHAAQTTGYHRWSALQQTVPCMLSGACAAARQPATPAAPSRAGFSTPHMLLKWASARPTWTYSTAGMARAMRSEGGHRSCRRFRSSSPERCQ